MTSRENQQLSAPFGPNIVSCLGVLLLNLWCQLSLWNYPFGTFPSLDLNLCKSGKLSTIDIVGLLDVLAKQGHVEWQDLKSKKNCIIMWRTPAEWGKLIYDWVGTVTI